MPLGSYWDSIQANLMSHCQVNKNLMVPRYFNFMFRLLIQGDKNYICEHDLFVFIQELEGMAPSSKDRRTSKILPSLLDTA